MSYKYVYVVSAGVDYEDSHPIRAFTTKKEADKFAKECQEYQNTLPPYPSGCEWDSVEVTNWMKLEKKWRKNHPAKDDMSHIDYYSVAKVPMAENAI